MPRRVIRDRVVFAGTQLSFWPRAIEVREAALDLEKIGDTGAKLPQRYWEICKSNKAIRCLSPIFPS
jgi:hypothetical protein